MIYGFIIWMDAIALGLGMGLGLGPVWSVERVCTNFQQNTYVSKVCHQERYGK